MPHSEPEPSSRNDVPLPQPGNAGSKGSSRIQPTSEPISPEAFSTSHQADPDSQPTVISAQKPLPVQDLPSSDRLTGQRMAQFELLESVGSGGMATVYKARDVDLGREVALKILPPMMAADPENVSRFKLEARAAAKLDHDNIARVYHCGEDRGLYFIAFEFVEGETIRQRMDRLGGHLPVNDAVHLMIQVAQGLSHADSRKVVHRDIKPSNILITPDNKAKIVDMGLARHLEPHSVNGSITQSGVTLGTFDYISPEQAIEPRSVDIRTDIYSMGCTFYHALTGHPPVPEGTLARKLHAHQYTPPIDPRQYNPLIPDELAAILGKMMAKEVKDRYQHPDHLVQHLFLLAEKLRMPLPAISESMSHRPAISGDPLLPPPPSFAPIAIALSLVVLIGIVVIFSGILGGEKADRLEVPFPNVTLAAKDSANPIIPGNTKSEPKKNPELKANEPLGPRRARSTAELLSLLKQGIADIELEAGMTYDITQPVRPGEAVGEALFTGKSLTLRGDFTQPPILRINCISNDPSFDSRLGSLTIRPNSVSDATMVNFKDLSVELVAPSAEMVPSAGIRMQNVDRIEIERCSFTLKQPLPKRGVLPMVIWLENREGQMPNLNLQASYVGPGVGLVQESEAIQVTATDCAFGPSPAIFQLGGTRKATPVPAMVRLEHCSFLMEEGAVVELRDRFPAQLSVGHCLFSAPDLDPGGAASEPPVVIRQRGMRAMETRYEAIRGEGREFATKPNAYHQVLPYGDRMNYTFEACQMAKLPIEDRGARFPVQPWQSDHPIDQLRSGLETPREAFMPSLSRASLRTRASDPKPLIGTNSFLTQRLYPLPLPKPEEESAVAKTPTRIWDPNLNATGAKATNVYRTLPEALVSLQPGETLLVRFNGIKEVDPIFLSKLDTQLVIKADTGFNPVLTLAQTTETVLFQLKGGKLLVDGLQFRLSPRTARALVAMPKSGECQFQNCVITLEDSDSPLSVVTILDPIGEMMPSMTPAVSVTPPKVGFSNCFIRGSGRVVHVRGSRPFEIDLKNSLVAIDSSFVELEPSQAGSAGLAQLRLQSSTFYQSGALLRMLSLVSNTPRPAVNQLPISIQSSNCVFAPPAAGNQPLIQFDRLENEGQVSELFAWESSGSNLYGFGKRQDLLRFQAETTDGMRTKGWTVDEWLQFTRESIGSFATFRFLYEPPTPGKSFVGVQPRDFSLKSSDPLPKAESGQTLGAPLSALPIPADGRN
jgi:serine/threonine protein kinase